MVEWALEKDKDHLRGAFGEQYRIVSYQDEQGTSLMGRACSGSFVGLVGPRPGLKGGRYSESCSSSPWDPPWPLLLCVVLPKCFLIRKSPDGVEARNGGLFNFCIGKLM